MEGEAKELLKRVEGDPTKKWDATVAPADPIGVIQELGANIALAAADVALAWQKAEAEGEPTGLHKALAEELFNSFGRISKLAADGNVPLPSIEDFVSLAVRPAPVVTVKKPAAIASGVVCRDTSERREWVGLERLKRPELIRAGRDVLSEKLEDFGFSGEDFDVVLSGGDVYLVYSGEKSMTLTSRSEGTTVRPTYSGIKSPEWSQNRTFMVNRVDGESRQVSLIQLDGPLYGMFVRMAKLNSKPVDRPESKTSTIITGQSPINRTRRCLLLSTDTDGSLISPPREITFDDEREGAGFRLAMFLYGGNA